MGLFDSFKKKAEGVVGAAAAPAKTAVSRPAPKGSTFEWNESTYPMPAGWSDLSMEDWFLKLERTRDRLMHVDEEDLEPMNDADGEPLEPAEVLLIKLGFESGNHWESFRSWGCAGWGAKTGEDAHDLEFRMSGIARDKMMAEKASAMSAPGGLLEPVEGVSLKDWARIYAGVAGGGNMQALMSQAGIDQAKWDRVSAEWMARMTTDTTMTIANEYGAAFAAGSQTSYGAHAAHAASVGVAGDLSAEPMSFERYVEVQEHMSAAADRGEDPNATFTLFGITAADFGNIGMYWSKRQQQEMTKYYNLYNEYSAKYSKKYRGT
ncbi:MAG TPA: DUF6620 family protein [Polyangiaceae bacterium]